MKKAFVTGITGTVAPYIKKELEQKGYQVFSKHFRINNDDVTELKKYIDKVRPDVIFHLALGPNIYTSTLANYAKEKSVKFVYVSTVSVFEDNGGGPYTKDTVVKVENNYGKYKYENEVVSLRMNPESYVIRIGWQISDTGDTDSNNMFHFIKDNAKDNIITVSDQFYPSTSFLPDTAKAVVDIVMNKTHDLYLVNSNLDKSLFDIIEKLNVDYELNLTVKKDSSFKRNDIMIDKRVDIRKI